MIHATDSESILLKLFTLSSQFLNRSRIDIRSAVLTLGCIQYTHTFGLPSLSSSFSIFGEILKSLGQRWKSQDCLDTPSQFILGKLTPGARKGLARRHRQSESKSRLEPRALSAQGPLSCGCLPPPPPGRGDQNALHTKTPHKYLVAGASTEVLPGANSVPSLILRGWEMKTYSRG